MQKQDLYFTLESTASSDAIAKLVELTERYCVVLQTLRAPIDVTTEVDG